MPFSEIKGNACILGGAKLTLFLSLSVLNLTFFFDFLFEQEVVNVTLKAKLTLRTGCFVMVKLTPSNNQGISVVVVTYHTGPTFFPALNEILDQCGVGQVVVVNNGNPADVVAALMNLAGADERVTLVSGHGNLGFAKGCNLGASHANGEVLFFLNPDSLISPGGIKHLMQEVGLLENSWLIGGRLLESTGEEQPGSRREALTPLRALGETLRLHHLIPNFAQSLKFNLHRDPLPLETIEVPVISGACMMLQKKDYWAIGGMDEDYFLHVEDIDFCHRFRQAGGKVYFCPHVSIVHHKSTSDAPKIFVEWHKHRGMMRFYSKFYRNQYPAALWAIVAFGVWLRFGLVASYYSARHVLGTLGIGRG